MLFVSYKINSNPYLFQSHQERGFLFDDKSFFKFFPIVIIGGFCMKIKNVTQTYSQECGICSIKNLLRCYKLKDDEVPLHINYQSEGNSLDEMRQTLLYYFKKVIVAKVDLQEISHLKKIQPFILMIHKNKHYHYVVVYQKKKNKFYLYDSAYPSKQILSFKELQILSTNIAILVEYPKEQIKSKRQKLKIKLKGYHYFIPVISIIESIFLILSSILLQQLIDHKGFNIYFYFLLQVALILIVLQKSKLFLNIFKHLDEQLVQNTFQNIYYLNPEYLKGHDREEIIYRLQDAYQMKIIILSFLFEWIGNFVIVFTAFIALLLFFYQFIYIILGLIPILIFSYFNFKKHGQLLENRRNDEYQFFDELRKDLQYGCLKKLDQNKDKLIKFQSSDYGVEKNILRKNNLLYFLQSMILTCIVAIYAFHWIENFTVGKLMACINIISLLIQPLFQLLSQANQFSNYRLLKQRLKDLQLYCKKTMQHKK